MKTVAMESTGVYWIPLFGVLEERGFEVMLVDPMRSKNVPGRKTAMLDCQWLQLLHTYGLLSGAFRPEDEIRQMRSYLRQRAMLVEHATRHVQHMQKALTQMDVKLQHVIRDITGKTGMDIIEAIVQGETSSRRLARQRDPRTQVRREDHREVATGTLEEGAPLRAGPGSGALPDLSGQDRRVRPGPSATRSECDQEIESQLERFEDRMRRRTSGSQRQEAQSEECSVASTSRASCTG